MENKTESVLAVQTALLRPFLTERGLIQENLNAALAVITERAAFLPRREAENDPAYKQIISYVTLLRGDEVFATRRLPKGGEARLHGLLSLGIGGHINEWDGAGPGALRSGLYRELDEEVAIGERGSFRFVGLINDDGAEVGRVHLGVFCTLEVHGEVCVRETEKLEGFWLRRRELRGRIGEMETWSAIVTEFFTA